MNTFTVCKARGESTQLRKFKMTYAGRKIRQRHHRTSAHENRVSIGKEQRTCNIKWWLIRKDSIRLYADGSTLCHKRAVSALHVQRSPFERRN